MPLRPPLHPRTLRIQASANRLRRPCFLQGHRPTFQHPRSRFHTSPILHADSNPPNHYETLSLTTSASPAEIKKQFFSLSKKYHPDKNPGDPNASTRFVQISEAYHVLSVPEKRASYDRDLARWTGGSAGSGGGVPKGSYSSAQGFAGSRPPSGLSRRRTQFRGPPPSFYKSGGYGAHGTKRTEHANQSASGSAEAGADQSSYGEFGGFGPGQTAHGNEVPHFDDVRHKQTHDHVNEFIHQKRRERKGGQTSKIVDEIADSGGTILNFVLVGGTIAFIVWTLTLFNRAEKKATPPTKGKE